MIRYTDRRTDDKWKDGQTDRQADRRAGGQTASKHCTDLLKRCTYDPEAEKLESLLKASLGRSLRSIIQATHTHLL